MSLRTEKIQLRLGCTSLLCRAGWVQRHIAKSLSKLYTTPQSPPRKYFLKMPSPSPPRKKTHVQGFLLLLLLNSDVSGQSQCVSLPKSYRSLSIWRRKRLMRSRGVLFPKVRPSLPGQVLKLSPSACSPWCCPDHTHKRRAAIFNHHLPRWQGTLMGCFISFSSQVSSPFCNCHRARKKQE